MLLNDSVDIAKVSAQAGLSPAHPDGVFPPEGAGRVSTAKSERDPE